MFLKYSTNSIKNYPTDSHEISRNFGFWCIELKIQAGGLKIFLAATCGDENTFSLVATPAWLSILHRLSGINNSLFRIVT